MRPAAYYNRLKCHADDIAVYGPDGIELLSQDGVEKVVHDFYTNDLIVTHDKIIAVKGHCFDRGDGEWVVIERQSGTEKRFSYSGGGLRAIAESPLGIVMATTDGSLLVLDGDQTTKLDGSTLRTPCDSTSGAITVDRHSGEVVLGINSKMDGARIALFDSEPARLAHGGQIEAAAVGVDGSVWWTHRDQLYHADPADGMRSTPVWHVPSGAGSVAEIVAFEDHIIVLTRRSMFRVSPSGTATSIDMPDVSQIVGGWFPSVDVGWIVSKDVEPVQKTSVYRVVGDVAVLAYSFDGLVAITVAGTCNEGIIVGGTRSIVWRHGRHSEVATRGLGHGVWMSEASGAFTVGPGVYRYADGQWLDDVKGSEAVSEYADKIGLRGIDGIEHNGNVVIWAAGNNGEVLRRLDSQWTHVRDAPEPNDGSSEASWWSVLDVDARRIRGGDVRIGVAMDSQSLLYGETVLEEVQAVSRECGVETIYLPAVGSSSDSRRGGAQGTLLPVRAERQLSQSPFVDVTSLARECDYDS